MATQNKRMASVCLGLALCGVLLAVAAQAQGNGNGNGTFNDGWTRTASATTIHTIGDSTVAVWPSRYYPKTGWGQDLQFFFDSSTVIIDDQAISGSSSKSFYDNNWGTVKDTLQAGDFVTIQFGIND